MKSVRCSRTIWSAPSPPMPMSRWAGFVKRMRGVLMYFKAENPAGHRIDRLFVEGEPVERERTYTVAFVTEQGVPKKFGRNRREDGGYGN